MKKIFYFALILILILGTISCSFDSKQSSKQDELPPGYVYVNFNIPSGISRSAPDYNEYDNTNLSKTFSLYAKLSSANDYGVSKTSGTFNNIDAFKQNLTQNQIALPAGTYDFLLTVAVTYNEQTFVALVGEVNNFELRKENSSVSISLRERHENDVLPETTDTWDNVKGGVNLTLQYDGDPTNVYGGLCTLINGTTFEYQTGYGADTALTATSNKISINKTELTPGDYYVHLIFKKTVNVNEGEQLYDQRMEWVHVAPGLTTTDTVTFNGDNTPYLITYQAKKQDSTEQLTLTWVNESSVIRTFNSSMTVKLPGSDSFNITGYDFDHWEGANVSVLEAGTGKYGWNSSTWTGTQIADQTVTAVFEPKTYNIKYYDGTDTELSESLALSPSQHTYDKATELPTSVTIDGYTFQGWYDNKTFTGGAVTTIAANTEPTEGNEFKFYAKLALNAGFTVTLPSYTAEDIIDGDVTYDSETGNISFKVKDGYENAEISVFLDASPVDSGEMGAYNLYQFTKSDLSVGYHQLLVVAKTDATYSQIKEFRKTGSN